MLTAAIIALTAAGIVIEYHIANTGATDVYVFSTLFRIAPDGHQAPDPELVYVVPGKPGEAVVGKYLAAIPPGLKVEAPELPYLMKVQPHQSIIGRAVVPLPLRLYTPYAGKDDPDPGPSGEVRRLRLRIGVLDAAKFPPPAPVVEPALPPPPDSFVCDYGFGVAIQQFYDAELSLPEPGVSEHFHR
jgi:hypothetical protein